jgi:hypothetical protein
LEERGVIELTICAIYATIGAFLYGRYGPSTDEVPDNDEGKVLMFYLFCWPIIMAYAVGMMFRGKRG